MPRGYTPRTHVWDGSGRKSSWDKETGEGIPTRQIKYNRRCKVCGIYLTTHAEDKIGVHIACVQTNNIKARTMSGLGKGPRYGSR